MNYALDLAKHFILSCFRLKLRCVYPAYNLFHTAFPDGFHWELVEVVAGPPNVVFKWRHWGTFRGSYKDHQGTGETIEVIGLTIAKVTEDLKIESVEHFFDTNNFLTVLTRGGCPVSH